MGKEFTSGNIFIRPLDLNLDAPPMVGHSHSLDHTTILFNRSVKISGTLPATGKYVEKILTGPDHMLIKAGVEHKIERAGPSNAEIIAEIEDMSMDALRAALIAARTADPIAWCVYSHTGPMGEIVQQPMGVTKSHG